MVGCGDDGAARRGDEPLLRGGRLCRSLFRGCVPDRATGVHGGGADGGHQTHLHAGRGIRVAIRPPLRAPRAGCGYAQRRWGGDSVAVVACRGAE